MLKIENTEVLGWEHAIRGMRNPLNSWAKSDSNWRYVTPAQREGHILASYSDDSEFWIGPNDADLMSRLRNAGTDHRKFMRMITVYVDITAPLYWWKEFDTYKVGTVANSCSTMHKIAEKPFMLGDFSYEHLDESECCHKTIINIDDAKDSVTDKWNALDILKGTIGALNVWRYKYINTPIEKAEERKHCWWQMIQLLPSSYNQRRTVMLNYEVLANIYKSRRNHKLDEWHTFCDWIEGLPYSELITAPIPQKGYEELQNYKEKFEELKKTIEEKHSITVCELCNIHNCGDSDEDHCKKCQFYKHSKWANWKKADPLIDELVRKGYTRTIDGNKIVYTKKDDAETNEGLNNHFDGIEE